MEFYKPKPPENTFVSNEIYHKCLEAMARSYVFYPDGTTYAPLVDWVEIDAQDAVDFGVLEEPKWHWYSDIAGMEMEWYTEELLKHPFIMALKVLHDAGLLKEPEDNKK